MPTGPKLPAVPGSAFSDMADTSLVARPMVEALLHASVNCRVDETTYTLHMEILAALMTCMSAQMFCELSAAVSLPTVTCTLSTEPPLAERVVARLLGNYIRRPPLPTQREGKLLSSVGSFLWLPWQVYAYFFRGQERPIELAERSLQVLLLLTQHLPQALFPDSTQQNAFLQALRQTGDDDGCAVEAEDEANVDPEEGRVKGASFSLRQLHDVICSQLPDEGSVVLLYLLLHGNRDFQVRLSSPSDRSICYLLSRV